MQIGHDPMERCETVRCIALQGSSDERGKPTGNAQIDCCGWERAFRLRCKEVGRRLYRPFDLIGCDILRNALANICPPAIKIRRMCK
ncbi:hypothetical protein NCH01_22560 [Neoasaia chiangmaiensis]|nr:hypothetical protein NCH01_22560 [Neoasaia chiangmaiensis]